MYTSVITKAEKATLQEDGTMFLDVEFDILEDGKLVDTKRLAFAPETASEAILEEVKGYTQNYADEIQAAVVNAEADAELAKADETIDDIIGQKVTIK